MTVRLVREALLPFLLANALLLLLPSIRADAAGADPAPFQVATTERFVQAACPAGTPAGTVCAAATGVGQIGRLGQSQEHGFGLTYLAQYSPATDCAPDAAVTTFTAADGDRLIVATTGTFCQTASGPVDRGVYAVVGGAGRFAGATGSGSYVTRATLTGPGLSGTSTSTMAGSLTLEHGDDRSRQR